MLASKDVDVSSTCMCPEIKCVYPDIKIPEVTCPDIKIPEITCPQCPDVRCPECVVPEYHCPDFIFPDIEMPDVTCDNIVCHNVTCSGAQFECPKCDLRCPDVICSNPEMVVGCTVAECSELLRPEFYWDYEDQFTGELFEFYRFIQRMIHFKKIFEL